MTVLQNAPYGLKVFSYDGISQPNYGIKWYPLARYDMAAAGLFQGTPVTFDQTNGGGVRALSRDNLLWIDPVRPLGIFHSARVMPSNQKSYLVKSLTSYPADSKVEVAIIQSSQIIYSVQCSNINFRNNEGQIDYAKYAGITSAAIGRSLKLSYSIDAGGDPGEAVYMDKTPLQPNPHSVSGGIGSTSIIFADIGARPEGLGDEGGDAQGIVRVVGLKPLPQFFSSNQSIVLPDNFATQGFASLQPLDPAPANPYHVVTPGSFSEILVRFNSPFLV